MLFLEALSYPLAQQTLSQITLLKYQNLSVSIISNNPVYSDALSTAIISMSVDEMLGFISKNKIKAIVLKKMGDKKTEIIYKTKGL